MSKSINQVILMGNLTRDPELRTTPTGQNVCSFSMAVNRSWAAANPKLVEKFLAVVAKGIAWFEDLNNRDQAVRLMVATSKLKQEDVEKSYDFLRGKHLFEPTGKVSKAKLNVILGALRELGDVPAAFPVDRLFLPGVTQVVD